MLKFFKLTFFIVLFLFSTSLFSQICGTPGGDGPVTVSSSINTYYPVSDNTTLNKGAQSIVLGGVPKTDKHNNVFGTTQISAGDLILIIQMQDAIIDYRNDRNYGSGNSNSGPDNLGGTGFTLIGNTGIFEYVIATNSVPLTGGNLTFKGTGSNGGTFNSFYNADATTTRGKRTFQIVRVPQYSNLKLNSDITTPPFNGIAGGVIAFNVSGTFDFNGKKIDGTARGFRGGYSPKAYSGVNDATTYVGDASKTYISGKGEGIAGTPRYMWDGYNQVDNIAEGLPAGSSGRGAPANAGGGGNDHNTGGGGGGNGGFGGLGGFGWQGAGGQAWPTYTGGGRPGFKSYLDAAPELTRLIMGGGGGAGDANNAVDGVKGGVGGAIILINAGTVQGTGLIEANGGNGAPGVYSGSPDGAGGAGAGGTVLLNISNSSTGKITINANGGVGGNTENDTNDAHGPGGGGGGGIIRHNLVGTVQTITSVLGGAPGKTTGGSTNGKVNGAISGTSGDVLTFVTTDLPPNLQVNSNCFPILDTKVKSLPKASACNSIGEKVSYEIQIKNTGVGNAAGVDLDFVFPTGIEFDSATAAYSADATGPSGALSNTVVSKNNPVFGGFNIARNGVVTIILVGKVIAPIAAGTYDARAQALYLDPTRTTASPTRKITAAANAYGTTTNKKYEGVNQIDVPGSNFNGTLVTVTEDDIKIFGLPDVPTIEVIQSTCETPTGTITVKTPVNGKDISYTLKGTNPVTAPISNTTGIFSGLVPNSYVVTTTNENGCTSLPTNSITINSVAGAPTTIGVSTCQGTSGILKATSTCSGTIKWYTSASGGTAVSSGASFDPNTVKGLIDINKVGTTVFYAACGNASSCRTATNFVINAIPTITGTTPAGRCDAGTVPLAATASSGTINWYSTATGGTSLGTGTSFTTPSLTTTKTYYVDATDNGCTTAVRTAVIASINTRPTINSTTEASSCGAAILKLKATASAGATIKWYADPTSEEVLGTGAEFITPNISTTTTYYVGATTAEGCTTTSRIAVAAVINTASTIVLTSGVQNPVVCTGTAIPPTVYTFGGSAKNAIVTNLPTELKYVVDTAAGTVTISGTPTANASYTITTVGHTMPCPAATINGTITMNASIPKPTLSILTQPTCTTVTGSFEITNYNSTYTYTITPSTNVVRNGAIITAPMGSYTVKATSGTCGSVDSDATVINAQPATPVMPTVSAVTQPTCATAKGSFTITNHNPNYTYTITPSLGVSQTGATVTAPAGSYKVQATLGTCVSVESAAAVINAQPATPVMPTLSAVTQPTCSTATGSFTITNYDPAYTYTVTPLTDVVRNGAIITAPAGSYKVQATLGTCISVESAAAVINAQPATPTMPTLSTVTQPTCATATGSFTITNYDPAYTYTITPLTDVVRNGATVTAPAGSYKVQATLGTCISVESAAAVINAQPATPTMPTLSTVTQPTCATATGSFTITNYDPAYTYTITPLTDVVRNGATVTAPAGSYKVQATLGTCGSVDSDVTVINAQPATPVMPTVSAVTQPTCATATGSFTITNYDPAYTYTITPSGATRNGATVTAPAGSYKVQATLGTCASVESVAAVINAQPATPAMPTLRAVTQPTCATATGSFTITNYDPAYTYTITPSGATRNGATITAPAGSYKVQATLGTCASVESVAAVINAQPATPVMPTVSAVTQPTCATATGSFTITNYDPAYTYTITPSGATRNGATVTAPAGSYKVQATLGTCISVESAAAVINSQPATPAMPSATEQTFCFVDAKKIKDLIATGSGIQWYNALTGGILYKEGDLLTSNTYYASQTTNGCESERIAVKVIVTETPIAGTLSGNQNICITESAAFSLSGGTAGGRWSSSDTAIATVNASTGAIIGVGPGTATIKYTVTGTGGCDDATAERVITISPLPTATITGTLEACLTTTLTAVTNAVSPSYVWYKDNSVINGETASTLVVTSNGNYKVKVISGSTFCEETSITSAVVVADTQKPVITCPVDINQVADANQCGATVAITEPTATDNCSTTFTFAGVRSDALALNAAYPVGKTTIVWTATDASGNTSASCEQIITITDTEKPVKPVLADVIAECSVTVTVPSTTDNCKGTVTGTTTDPLEYTAQGTYSITWSFNDGNGNIETALQQVIIKDTQKPVITCPVDINQVADANQCGATVAITEPTATDNCSTTFTFAGVRSDALALNAAYPVGKTTIVWTATDASGNTSASCEQIITITDTEKPVKPVLADVIAECSVTVTVPSTTDNCKGTVTGTTTDPLEYTAQGTYSITWSFNDGNGNIETALQQVIIKDTQKSVITCPTDINQVADANQCGATVAITEPTATDNCSTTFTFAGVRSDALALNAAYPVGKTTIVWTATDASGNTSASCEQIITITDTEKPVKPVKPVLADVIAECSVTVTVPSTTDNCKGTVTGTTTDPLEYTAQGTYSITWSFDDGNGNIETALQQVIIKDTQKPVITCPVDINQVADANQCGATVAITEPTATDNCSTTFTFAGVRSDALALNAAYPVGKTTIVWTATDASGNTSASCEQIITITDTEKPVKPVLADVIAECSVTVTVPSTTDNCKGTVTGTTTDPLEYTAQGTYSITWSFDDGNGNIETALQQVIIKDTQKPVITCPVDINQVADANQCGATVAITEPTATDNCSTTFTFAGVRSDALALNAAYPVGKTTIVWTATDASGNTSASCEQIITITDTEKPVKPVLADVIAECSVTVTVPSTTDNCKGTVTGTTTDPLEYTAQGTYSITWSFNDGNGNIETALQQVIIKDTQKPVITCPTDINQVADANQCGATVAITEPTATDNCSTTFTFAGVRSDALALNAAYPVGKTTIVWTATDTSGNTSASCEQIITITDTEKPVITCPVAVIANTDAGLCTATMVLSAPTVIDNCGIASVVNDAPLVFPIGVTTVTWTVIDNNGNVSTCTQTVTVFGPIKSNDDLGVSINGYVGGIAVSNVLDNDLLNCVSVISNQVKITLATTLPSGVNFDTTTGEVTVNPHTPSGIYTFDYTICDLSNISNCSTSTVKVIVDNPVIKANPETTTPINGNTGGKTPALTANDKLNGVDVVIGTQPGDVVLTPVTVPTGLTLNPDGTVTIAPNTPAGNYDVKYKICEVTNPTNCDEVTSVIEVGAAAIDAQDDNVIYADGINGSLEVINVLDNDKLNGIQINNPAVVTIKSLNTLSGITLNVDGTIDVAPNTAGGTYTLNYQICDVINKTSCVTAKVTIFVAVPSIAVIKTAVFNDENKSGYANAGETITYKFKITNTGNTPLTNITVSDPLPGLVMTGGPITLGVNETDEHTFIGIYVIKQADINAGKISNQATVYGTSANAIIVEDKSDYTSNVDDNPTVSPIEGCVIKVFNAISPNGDSMNERFYIQGLECYPENTVEIYNRWGVLVFERERYNNEERAFRGISEGRTTVKQSDGLPVGTYYYVLKYKDSESNAHQEAGYLYINK